MTYGEIAIQEFCKMDPGASAPELMERLRMTNPDLLVECPRHQEQAWRVFLRRTYVWAKGLAESVAEPILIEHWRRT